MKLQPIGATFLLLMLAHASVLYAQIDAGIVGGISIPNLSASGSDNNPLNTGYSSRLGPEFGLAGEYHLTQIFSIAAKIVYSSQGGKKNGLQAFPTPAALSQYFQLQGMQSPPYMYANYKSEAKINYLRIPVLAKFGWNLGLSPMRFWAAAGPFAGFLLSAKQVTSGNSPIYTDPKGQNMVPVGPQSFAASTNIRDQLHKVNFGIDANVGLAYSFGHMKMSSVYFEAGGNYGLINIQKGSANGKNNTGAATVLLGYAYRLRRV